MRASLARQDRIVRPRQEGAPVEDFLPMSPFAPTSRKAARMRVPYADEFGGILGTLGSPGSAGNRVFPLFGQG